MDRVQNASERSLSVAHLAIRSTRIGVVPTIVQKKYSYPICPHRAARRIMQIRSHVFAYCADILLLVLFWHIRIANASTCPEGTYRESVKFKGTLASNPDGCQELATGTYLEHDDPAEHDGARVYKLQNTADTTGTFFLYYLGGGYDRYYGGIAVGYTGNVNFWTTTTFDTDIEFLGDWIMGCDKPLDNIAGIMKISIDSIVCSQCPPNSASSSFGTTTIASCRCNAGYTGEGSCTA